MSPSPASLALRRCLRTQRTIATCRKATPSNAARSCIASAICPARRSATQEFAHSTSAALRTQATQPKSFISKRSLSSSTVRLISSSRPNPQPSTSELSSKPPSEVLEAPSHLNDKERAIWTMLQEELRPTKLQVRDISGGCGSMYGIEVVSERFRGVGMLGQQRIVNKVLEGEIKGWHGVQLRTGVP